MGTQRWLTQWITCRRRALKSALALLVLEPLLALLVLVPRPPLLLPRLRSVCPRLLRPAWWLKAAARKLDSRW